MILIFVRKRRFFGIDMDKKTSQELNDVLAYQNKELNNIQKIETASLDKAISESEALLQSLGYELPERTSLTTNKKELSTVDWDTLVLEARKTVGDQNKIEDLFSESELAINREAVKAINHDFKQIYKLDKYDYMIAFSAGFLSAVTDILLVGIPKPGESGTEAGPLSNWIRDKFDKWIPEEKISILETNPASKVPFDAQDNRNTNEYVEGLSSYYHRIYELGHDPLIGFVVGVYDIMHGSMTTIDKNGAFVTQILENYADRKEGNFFKAIYKEFIHLLSDVNTEMGLPAPLMGLLNLIQTGPIYDDKTLSEIIRNMYYQGYDFIHACSLSIPVLIIEVLTRMLYSIKRMKEGVDIKDAIAISTDREKNPKLGTILFISHSIATAANAGKIYFADESDKLQAINYLEFIAFAINSFKQLKWAIIDKPELATQYYNEQIYSEMDNMFASIDEFNKTHYIFTESKETALI